MNPLTIIILILILLLCLIFFFKSKIINLTSHIPSILFPTFLIISLGSLFLNGIFIKMSDYTLKQSGIHSSIVGFDHFIQSLSPKELFESAKEGTKNWLDKAKNIFQDEKNDNSKNDSEIEIVQNEEEKGFLEIELYPKIVSIIAFLYKAFFLILGLTGLGFSIYIGYTMQATIENRNLRQEIDELKKEVSNLKKMYN